MTTLSTSARRIALALVASVLAPLAVSGPLAGDDRDLFRQSSDAPYLFILFDTTGSMAWNLGNNRTPTRRDEDTRSRMFQAKSALDTVMQTLQTEGAGVNLGFATFPDQNGHYAYSKVNTFLGQYISDRETDRDWCRGFEPTNDRWEDVYRGYTFKWPEKSINDGLKSGDIVPLNWADDNIQNIRERLAPNLALGETTPDYGIARYFKDSRQKGQLRLRDDKARPFMANGNTPLEGALNDFNSWHDSWKKKAEDSDPQFALGCRSVSVVLLTDGFETCGGRPTRAAQNLRSKGIKTYVIGFAVNNPALDAIATSGGTDASPGPDGQPNPGDPEHEAYFAGDEQALVDAFLSIIGDVKRQSRTFATAAVPSVVGSTADEVFLTSFSPVEDGTQIWPGRVDAYVKPIPLTKNAFGQEVPNRNAKCSGPADEGCLAWDAAELLADQAPTAGDVGSNIYRVSNSPSDRRVYWAGPYQGSVPRDRNFFVPPSDFGTQIDLYGEMGFDVGSPSLAADGRDVIRWALQRKYANILDPTTGGNDLVDFVLGDVFHADPVVLAEPSRFDYFSKDLEGQTAACDDTNKSRNRYPCFLRDHLYRRKVLFVASNEGQLHAFDAGKASKNTDGTIEFDVGSGKEIFSFVPRAALPKIRNMSEGGGHQFSVDGTVTIDDALIDPENSYSVDPPDLNAREWRSVLIGGMREGGRSYYALDVTQPDPIATDTGLPDVISQVPTCANGASGCGPIPYPMPMWEFTDTWDEDADNPGAPDLGDTWSRVNIGRIRVIEGTASVDKYVAVFGGGLDADFKAEPIDPVTEEEKPYSGNYLYMVDIETGQMIYKRRLDIVNGVREAAMVPSEAAAVDTDQDSYLDTIYIGTTAGYMFKVDLSKKVELEKNVEIKDYSTSDPTTGSPPLKRRVDRITDALWEPFPIFDTGARPIYFPPSVIFVSDLASYALAWGTGDREDLWSDVPVEGRFYVLLDDQLEVALADLPYTEAKLEGVDADASKAASPIGNLLTNPDTSKGNVPGWVLELDTNERVIAKSFGLAGVVFFNSYIPNLEGASTGVCSSSGKSRLYSIFATNGLGIRTSGKRYKEVGDFTTRPFVEASGATKKGSSKPIPPPDECDSEELEAMAESIKSLMPTECKFANYRLNVMTLESSSGLQCLVPVPVCVIERNWKEF